MVARLTLGKKKYAGVEAQMYALLERAEALRADLTEAIQKDAKAFEAVMAVLQAAQGHGRRSRRRASRRSKQPC